MMTYSANETLPASEPWIWVQQGFTILTTGLNGDGRFRL